MDKTADSKLISLFLKGQKETYKKGEIVFSPSSQDKRVYYIETGHINIQGINEKGVPCFSEIYQPGRIFPIIRAYSSGPYPIKATSLDSSVLYSLNTLKFRKLTSKDMATSQALVEYLASLCLNYLARVRNLEEKNVYRRLVTRLLHYAVRFGVKKNGYIQIEVPLTQAIIAESIATSRESVTRNLRKLEEKGLIVYHKKHLTILDEKRLMAENLTSNESENQSLGPR